MIGAAQSRHAALGAAMARLRADVRDGCGSARRHALEPEAMPAAVKSPGAGGCGGCGAGPLGQAAARIASWVTGGSGRPRARDCPVAGSIAVREPFAVTANSRRLSGDQARAEVLSGPAGSLTLAGSTRSAPVTRLTRRISG